MSACVCCAIGAVVINSPESGCQGLCCPDNAQDMMADKLQFTFWRSTYLKAMKHLLLMVCMSFRMLLEPSMATDPKKGKVQAGLLAKAPAAAGALPGPTGTAAGAAAPAWIVAVTDWMADLNEQIGKR